MSLIKNAQRALGFGKGSSGKDPIEFGPVMELAIVDESGTALFIPDASVLESHTKEIELTSNPVEFGAEVTDHSIILPRTFTVEGRITNTPIKDNIDEFSDSYGKSSNNSGRRVAGAWEFLNAIADARDPVYVRTGLQTYEDMILKSLSVNQDWKTSQVLDFRAEFKEIFIIKTTGTLSVNIELPAGATTEQASATINLSIINTENLTSAEVNSATNSITFFQ